MASTLNSSELVARLVTLLRGSRSRALHHFAAAGCASLALLLRWLADPMLGDRQPLSLVFAAVALVVWLSGYKPALTAMVLGYLGADYFFTDPRGAIAISTDSQLFHVLTYLLSCAIVIAFGESLRRSHEKTSHYAQQLEKHREELRQIDQNKDEFLATLAHELRNPLMAVSNVAQILQRRSDCYPELKDVSRILNTQTAHVTRLVEDLLDLSRIRTGQILIRNEVVTLQEVLITVVDSARPMCDRASLGLELRLPEQNIAVTGDFARMNQVFMNLISNAARYTPSGGNISVSLQCDARFALVRVRDSGIGIPKDMLERIFELFEQTHSAVAHSRRGLGIGLALVRKLVTLHGGTVEAHSEGTDSGSEFIVRLPLHSSDRNSASLDSRVC